MALSSVTLTRAADLPTADPESLGFSAERLARIAPAIQREIAAGQYPGAVMLVARNGRIVYFDSVGQLDPAGGKPMTKDAIFRLYSMTKPYTSVAIMMLMEEGKLRVTGPVSRYLPALANLQVSVEKTDPYTGAAKYLNVPVDREINIQDLLRHTSGMVYAGYTAHPKVRELYTKEGVDWKDVTPAEQIERLAKVPLAHQPGTTTLPAGTGFGLGFAVRKETGRFEVTGNAGEYYWAGAAGTGFYVDPKEGIICVSMTQAQPGIARRYDRYLFKQMVYQAIAK